MNKRERKLARQQKNGKAKENVEEMAAPEQVEEKKGKKTKKDRKRKRSNDDTDEEQECNDENEKSSKKTKSKLFWFPNLFCSQFPWVDNINRFCFKTQMTFIYIFFLHHKQYAFSQKNLQISAFF